MIWLFIAGALASGYAIFWLVGVISGWIALSLDLQGPYWDFWQSFFEAKDPPRLFLSNFWFFWLTVSIGISAASLTWRKKIADRVGTVLRLMLSTFVLALSVYALGYLVWLAIWGDS